MEKYKPYTKYKRSEEKWVREVPVSWGLVPLKYISKFTGGGTPNKDNAEYWRGDIPWVSPKDMKKSELFSTIDNITQKAIIESSTTLIEKNALLMVVRSGILQHSIPTAVNRVSVTLNQDMKAMRFNRRVFVKYGFYLIKGNEKLLLLEWAKQGATVESIEQEYLANTVFPVPSLNEQQKIAEFLDHETAKIDTLIEKQQELIKLLKEKRQAVISHAVTKGLNPNAPMRDSGVEWIGEIPANWESKKLKHVAEIVDCRNKTPEYYENGEYLVVRTTNVKNQKLELKDALYTDEKNFKIWTQRGIPPVGSILFTREAPTGEICLVPDDVKFCMGQRMMNFICKDVNYSGFLFDYLLSDCLTRHIESVSHGSTVSHLRVEQVENIPVVVPTFDEINGIHQHIKNNKNKYKKIIRSAEQAISLMAERRTALISAAVTGQIDVRDWQPDEKTKPGIGGMSDIKLFSIKQNSAVELASQTAQLEKKLQQLVERDMEVFLGIRFVATEYSTGRRIRGELIPWAWMRMVAR